MRMAVVILGLCLSGGAVAGPISKFEERKPDLETVSSVPLFDLERCFTDMEGWPVPFIYRQPGRLDQTNMLWVHPSYGTILARAHLKKVKSGVAVRIWNAVGNQWRSCVQSGKPRQKYRKKYRIALVVPRST